MHLSDTITDKSRMAKPAFGSTQTFPAELVSQADRVEVHSSSFDDPGEDWNLFQLMAGPKVLASFRQSGY